MFVYCKFLIFVLSLFLADVLRPSEGYYSGNQWRIFCLFLSEVLRVYRRALDSYSRGDYSSHAPQFGFHKKKPTLASDVPFEFFSLSLRTQEYHQFVLRCNFWIIDLITSWYLRCYHLTSTLKDNVDLNDILVSKFCDLRRNCASRKFLHLEAWTNWWTRLKVAVHWSKWVENLSHGFGTSVKFMGWRTCKVFWNRSNLKSLAAIFFREVSCTDASALESSLKRLGMSWCNRNILKIVQKLLDVNVGLNLASGQIGLTIYLTTSLPWEFWKTSERGRAAVLVLRY